MPSMYTFLPAPEFDGWLKQLRDPTGKAGIIARIRSAPKREISVIANTSEREFQR